MKRIGVLIIVFLTLGVPAFAQLEDYIGNDVACQTEPPDSAAFLMVRTAASDPRTSLSNAFIVVGDVDPAQDATGISEIITIHRSDERCYILRGSDLSTKRTIDLDLAPDESNSHAIADTDENGCAEIYIPTAGNPSGPDPNGYYLEAYNACTGAKLWRRQLSGQGMAVGIADLNQDGTPEIYTKLDIIRASDGVILNNNAASNALKGSWNSLDSGPVAVDILPTGACTNCAGLELVLGGRIYAVSDDNTTITLERNINSLIAVAANQYYPKRTTLFNYITSTTSVADFNQDGNLDVLMGGAVGSVTGATTAWFWNVSANTYTTYTPSNNWSFGMGRINIADIDGNGQLNATFVSGSTMFALKEDFTELWTVPVEDFTSGYTSTTVFDFNNDGAYEIVYRDEGHLYIYNGKNGQPYPLAPRCNSGTRNEYPIVADIDNDGATEICIACSTNDDPSAQGSIGEITSGEIRKYESGAEPWVPARKLWNQHGYFNVNVYDDLTIPQVQRLHHTALSTGTLCPGDTVASDQKPLNSFLNQAPYLDSDGCTTYAAPDIGYDDAPGGGLSITAPTCPDKKFLISFRIKNFGNTSVTDTLPITFYKGDPLAAGATKLNTINIPLNDLDVGDVQTVTDSVEGTGGYFTLYVVLNDDGSTVPSPITIPNPNNSLLECDYNDNIAFAAINPNPFALSIETTDDVKCAGSTSSTSNGTAYAFKFEVPDDTITSGYNFYWFNGHIAGSGAATTATAVYDDGPLWENLGMGNYSVYALNNSPDYCSSDTVEFAIDTASMTLNLNIVELAPYTKCKFPGPDGAMQVIVNGVVDANDNVLDPGITENLEYEWYKTSDLSTIVSTTDTWDKADNFFYTVIVTDTITGCVAQASDTVSNNTPRIDVTFTTVPAKCSPTNSGSATAFVGTSSTAYTFEWYIGISEDGTPDTVSQTFLNRTPGFYSVIAVHNGTQCSSNLFTTSIGTETGPTAATFIVSPQTSCDPGRPNGSARAEADGATAGYTFQWFEGNSTLAADAVPAANGGNTHTIFDVAAGIYTVMATDTDGCSDTETVNIPDNIVSPTVTPSVVNHQTTCNPPNGQVTANAAVTAGPFDYYWFDGNVGIPDTTAYDFKGQNYSGLVDSTYTVVAVDRNTHCPSPRQTIIVNDNTVPLTITPTVTPKTTCDPGLTPNGRIDASTAPADTYTYRWWSGNDTTVVANFIGTGTFINDRAAGTYIVKATSTTTGCSDTEIGVINDASAKPVISLTTDANNTICDIALGFNGQISATITSNPNFQAGHVLRYDWSTGASGPSNTLSGLNGGVSYSGTVTNVTLGCTSDPASTNVNNNTIPPDIGYTPTPSTSCDPAKANGSLEAFVNPGATANYTFTWYNGPDDTAPVIFNVPLASPIQGGRDYTVKVENDTTGCIAVRTIPLADNSVNPVISLTPTANTICDGTLGYDGVLSASITSDPNSLPGDTYSYVWVDIDNGNTTLPDITSSIAGFPAGAYSAAAMNIRLGCESDPVIRNITDNFTYPDIVLTPTPAVNCDPALPTGALLAQVDEGGGTITALGYTFQWHNGNLPNSPIGGETDSTLTNRNANISFTAEVRNTSTGCEASLAGSIPDNSAPPTLDVATVTNIGCDAGKYTGEATASFATNPNAQPGHTYTYTWVDVDNGNAVLPETVDVITAKNGGNYSVKVLNNDLGCESPVLPFTISNNFTFPDIVITPTPSTNCPPLGAPDGEMQAEVDEGGTPTTTGYTFQWYQDIVDTNPANEVGTSQAHVTGLQGGVGFDYTVRAENDATGCQSTETLQLADAHVLPTFTLSPTNDTSCDPSVANGTLTASVAAAPGLFGYQWLNESTATAIPDEDELIGDLVGNENYSAILTDSVTGCASAKVFMVVPSVPYVPMIDVAVSNHTFCTSNNGELDASITNPIAGTYSFDWYDGNDDTGPVVILGNNVAANLEGNKNYVVYTTHAETLCENNRVVFLPRVLVIPTVDINAYKAADYTNCEPGQVEATVLESGIPIGGLSYANYEFTWYRGNSSAGTLLGHDTDSLLTTINGADRLPTDNYTVIARNTITDCTSAEYFDFLESPPKQFDIDFPIDDPATSCVATGRLGAEVLIGGIGQNPANYNFQWHPGLPIGAPPNTFYTDPQVTFSAQDAPTAAASGIGGDLLDNQPSATYTLVITDINTGCREFVTKFLGFVDQPAIVSVLGGVPETCALLDGEITIRLDPPPGGGATEDDYQLYAFSTGNPDLSDRNLLIPNNPGTTLFAAPLDLAVEPNPYTILNLPAGVYTIIAQEKPGVLGNNQCLSEPKVFEVKKTLPPVVDILGKIANRHCPSVQGDGSVEIEIAADPQEPVDPTTIDYLITVEEIATTAIVFNNGPAYLGGATETIPALNSGNHRIRVEDSNDCVTEKIVEIIAEPKYAQPASFDINGAQFCDALLETNASIEVTDVDLVSGGNEDISEYQFTWYSDAALATQIYQDQGAGGTTGELISNVKTGAGVITNASYWLMIEKNADATNNSGGLGCESGPFKFDIPNNTVNPTVTLTPTPNSSCDLAVFEGEIDLQASTAGPVGYPGNDGPGVTYSYTGWTSLGGAAVPANAFGAAVTVNYNGLEHDEYTVIVENEITGCQVTGQTEIIHSPPVFVITPTAVPQITCPTGGRITLDANVAQTNPNAVVNISDFTVTWHNAVGGAALQELGVDVNDAFIDNTNYTAIAAGTYYARAVRNLGTGIGQSCPTAYTQSIIQDQRQIPVITLSSLPNTSCDPAVLEGSIELKVETPGVAGRDYDYVWVAAGGSAVPNVMPPDPAYIQGTDYTFNSLADDTYTLTVTDNTSNCPRTADITINAVPQQVFILDADVNPYLFCPPNHGGSVEVTSLSLDGVTPLAPADFANFTFEWAENDPGTPIGGATTALLDDGNYANIDSGVYYVVARRLVNTALPGAGCPSAPFTVTLPVETQRPAVSLTTLPNTNCTGFNGSITTVVTNSNSHPNAGLNYTFSWDALAAGATINVAPPAAGTGPYTTDPTDIITAGSYTIRVRDNFTACEITGPATVLDQRTPVEILDVAKLDQTLCDSISNPSGRITVTSIRTGGLPANIDDFDFVWHRTDTLSAALTDNFATAIIDSVLVPGTAVGQYPTLGAGTYFVRAIKRAGTAGNGDGCPSRFFTEVINDVTVRPSIVLSATPNTFCVGTDAEIQVSLSHPMGGNYDYDWDLLPDQLGAGNTATISNVAVNTYTLTATNLNSHCVNTGTVQVLPNPAILDILRVDKQDQTDCAPANGSITIRPHVAGYLNLPGDYDITIAPFAPPDSVQINLAAGAYTVSAVKTSGVGTGCTTSNFPVSIIDITQDPVITATMLPNKNCVPALGGTGELSASATEGATQGITAGYTIDWFNGTNTTAPADFIATGSSINSLLDGTYTVRFTDIDGANFNLGCFDTVTVRVDQVIPVINTVLDTISKTVCAPLNGEIRVVTVQQQYFGEAPTLFDLNNAAVAANFEFDWNSSGSFAANRELIGQDSGTYTVVVRNMLNGCPSNMSSGVIDDRAPRPVPSVVQFSNAGLCVLPEIQGTMRVAARLPDGSLSFDPAQFTFNWYVGDSVHIDSLIATSIDLPAFTASDRQVYTLELIDLTTNCPTVQPYTFKPDTITLNTIASATPISSCAADNGTLYSTTRDAGGPYGFEWYLISTPPGVTPPGPLPFQLPGLNNEHLNMSQGTYVAIARNVTPGFSYCPSTPDTVIIDDNRMYPSVTVMQLSPVINCDPLRPDGAARARANGTNIGYTFNWYEDVQGGTPVFTGSEVNNLKGTPVTYFVTATHNISRCEGTNSIVIEYAPDIIPTPFVNLLSHRTNCISNNGALQVVPAVGALGDYSIEWYNGNSVVLGQAQGFDDVYSGLDAGNYTVRLIDLATGCPTEPVTDTVELVLTYPEFKVQTENTPCEQTAGTATYVPLNEGELTVKAVIWNIHGDSVTGTTAVSGLDVGTYSVMSISTDDCPSDIISFEIKPDIAVYNAISKNDDGVNDFFEIACIENYQGNSVKIFNRAGTLVYEGVGYNNIDVNFSGVSNKGVNILGNELPDGTYFYIIDRGDGSEPKTGYLELLR